MAAIGHWEKIRALAATPQMLVTGGVRTGAKSEVVIYDHVANKNTCFFELEAHVMAIAIAGDWIVAGATDGALHIHRVEHEEGKDRDVRRVPTGHGVVTAVAVAPDTDRVASAGTDGVARTWSVATGAKLGEWALASQPLRAVAVDPSGEYLAAAGDDGVVRVVTLATGAVRVMAGHAGPVYALAFTPRDGRLASGGDDGTVRLWYVVGEIECEVRGGDESGHAGPVLALLIPPSPAPATPGADVLDRLWSAGADGKVKVWQLENRRKPRTLDCGDKPVQALAYAPPMAKPRATTAAVWAGGERRTLFRFGVAVDGAPVESAPGQFTHAFDVLAANLLGAVPAREAAVATLAEADEPEALEMLRRVLRTDAEPKVRALAARLIGEKQRRDGRAVLREKLDDEHALVRAAVLAALRAIDGDKSLLPLRAALGSRFTDMRIAALRALVPLRATSPLVPGLIAGALKDADAAARGAAIEALLALYPAGDPEPLRVAFERGPADVQIEVLERAAIAGLLSSGPIAPIVARAIDDPHDGVRRTAFTVKVLERRALASKLEARDEGFARNVHDVMRRAVQLAAGSNTKQPTEDEIRAARAALPGIGSAAAAPSEADLEPLLTALACRTADTALRGARGLAQLGDTRALGALLQLSRETAAPLRREAARALQELSDPRAQKRLVWMLDDADAAVRAAALDAYAKLQPDAPLTVAEAALRSSHEDMRVRGLDRLVQLGADAKGRSPEAETLLGDALEDESAKVRSEAFRTLWAWHDKDPAKALDRALAARFPDLRQRANVELETHGKEAWALERLEKAIDDRDGGVAMTAYVAVTKLRGDADAEAHLRAMGSVDATVRLVGAKGASGAPVAKVRQPVTKLLQDDHAGVRIAAVETLNKLLPDEAGPLYAALQSAFLDLKVRAAELLAVRHDEQLIDPMRSLLADKELPKHWPAEFIRPLRQRAASALATLGSPRLLRYFATELLKDEQPEVREQAARGLAMACRRGDESYLLDALGNTEVWVRSWAADGLSRLGDVRALPVLTGTLRHEHLPIRRSAIVSFAALGPEGFGGILHGLEDPLREVQEMVFAIVLARDLRAFRAGTPPDLLTSALSSQRPEVRFAAARALELRVDPEAYVAHVIDVLAPPKPEKAGDMKDWPSEEARGRILVGLADALASDTPEQRYAAAQVLALNAKPLEYFREAQRVAKLRSLGAPWIADTTPRRTEETDTKPARGWLRRLFSGDGAEKKDDAVETAKPVPTDEQLRLRRLAFGAYVGLLRQEAAGDDEGHRVRRDAVDRIVELGVEGGLGRPAAIPAVVRALDDGHYLVRKAALAGLKKLLEPDADAPLSLALGSRSADVARAALDELAVRGEGARGRIAAALDSSLPDVRRYAFELLEKLSPKGSLEPLLAALGSEHADLRIGVVERLASSNDVRVLAALLRAMESDHDDLRLRAAELLAQRSDDRTVDVLAGFLRSDDAAQAGRAVEALVRLGTPAAVRALGARLDEVEHAPRVLLVRALGRVKNVEAADVVAQRFEDEAPSVRLAAIEAALDLMERDRKKRDQVLAMRLLPAAAHARDPQVRLTAAHQLDTVDDAAANELLTALFGDRDAGVRAAAVERYATRVVEKGAPVGPLEAVLRAGARELVLPAAEGVAHTGNALALRPLLLVTRAGEAPERRRALLALGTLGDPRALAEIENVAAGGTPEAPVDPADRTAATEALGRITNKLTDPEARRRVIEKVEQAAVDAPDSATRIAAIAGLRWIGGERARTRLEAIVADTGAMHDVRARAAVELGAMGDTHAEAALARALGDSNFGVRTEARKALDKLFPDERTRIELHAVDSAYADIAQPAALYLASEGDAAVLVARLATLANASLRQKLRFGLARRGAVPTGEMVKLFANAQPAVRAEVAWLLGAALAAGAKVSDADRATLSTALREAEALAAKKWAAARPAERDAEATAWARSLWAASRLPAGALLPRVRELIASGERAAPAVVRREAVRAVDRLGGAAETGPLAQALADLDPGVRSAAASALGHHDARQAATRALAVKPFDPVAFGPTAGDAAARAAVLGTDAGRRIALPAVLAASQSEPLVALTRGTDVDARRDAVSALGRVGGADAIATLEAMAFDKKGGDIELRKAAYRAYKRARRKAARDKTHEARS